MNPDELRALDLAVRLADAWLDSLGKSGFMNEYSKLIAEVGWVEANARVHNALVDMGSEFAKGVKSLVVGRP